MGLMGLMGFMGYSLDPMLVKTLVMPGGSQTIMLALAATGATFLALSAYVLKTRHNFSFMGGFLFAGMAIAILAGLGALFFQIPALGLAVSAMVALLSAGLIRYETGKIVNGGEDNYVLATVGLLKPANASVSRKRVVLTTPGVLPNSAGFLPSKQACGTVPHHKPV